jgi:glycosyltransferase involved in cell wall biosynthesis
MRVLHINWSGRLGGAERFAYSLAAHQDKATIAYMSQELTMGARAETNGISVAQFLMKSGFDLVGFLKYVVFIKSQQFDVIHDHNGPPLVRLSKLFSPRSVFIQHIHGTKWGNAQWERTRVLFWKWTTNWLVDHYIANSEHTRRIASLKEKIPLRCISVISNGIDLSEFSRPKARSTSIVRNELGIKEEDWVVGIVASLTPAKGIDKFIRVAKEVEGATFVVVGDGELRNDLQKLVSDLGLGDRVIFAGARENTRDILGVFDVFLLTSNWEAFGISSIEAMAVGVPVVAFRVDGVSEVVSDGCGILIPPSVKEAVKSLVFLRDHPDAAREMADQASRLVRNKFDIRKIAAQVEQVYAGRSKSV